MQLQSITWAKAQLKWELAHEWEGLARKYEDWQTRMAMKHEDQWARMAEEVDATFRRSSLKQAQLTQLGYFPGASPLPNPGMIPICYMSEALATTVQWRVDAQQPPPHQSLRAHRPSLHEQPCTSNWDSTSSNSSHVRHSLIGTPQLGAHSSGSSSIPSTKSRITPPMAHPMINLARGPMLKLQRLMSAVGTALHRVMGNCLKQHWRHPTMAWLPLGSTGEHDSEDNTDHCGDESNQDESRENAANSDLESASGDCLTCLDTEEVAIRTAQKRFWKKVWASCSIARGCLWSEAQLKWIQDSHQAVWESDHEIIWTEWELTLEEDCPSFQSEQDDGQNWPTTLNQRGHPLENPHMGIRGWGPWLEENPHAISKTIPCMLLLIVWKGYDPGHGQPPRATYEVMLLDAPTSLPVWG